MTNVVVQGCPSGIARCFTYGGAKGRPLFDPLVEPQLNISKEQYVASNKNKVYDVTYIYCVGHFDQKYMLGHTYI